MTIDLDDPALTPVNILPRLGGIANVTVGSGFLQAGEVRMVVEFRVPGAANFGLFSYDVNANTLTHNQDTNPLPFTPVATLVTAES